MLILGFFGVGKTILAKQNEKSGGPYRFRFAIFVSPF